METVTTVRSIASAITNAFEAAEYATVTSALRVTEDETPSGMKATAFFTLKRNGRLFSVLIVDEDRLPQSDS